MRRRALEVLGGTIRTLRRERELTQEQLAELADAHVNWISMVERGHRNPSALSLAYIARALKVKPSELWKDLDEEDPRELPRKPARLRGRK